MFELGNEIDKRLRKQFTVSDQLVNKFQDQIKPGSKMHNDIKGTLANAKKTLDKTVSETFLNEP